MELESFKELRIESDESKEKAATSGLSYDDLEIVSRNSRVKTKDKMDRATNEQVSWMDLWMEKHRRTSFSPRRSLSGGLLWLLSRFWTLRQE